MNLLFSSPEPKAQESVSFQNLSVVVVVVVVVGVVVNFSHFSSPEQGGQFQPNLAQCILGCKGFNFVQMKDPAFNKGRSFRNGENALTKLKNLLEDHWADSNQIWHNAS